MQQDYQDKRESTIQRWEPENPPRFRIEPSFRPTEPPPVPQYVVTVSKHSHPVAARCLSQAMGLHPISGIGTLTVNAMLFTGTVMSMGMLLPVAFIAGGVLGFATYKIQMSLYGDSHDVALAKSLLVGLVTALPVGLPAFLTVPSTVMGVVHTIRRKD